jgi:hypothetical protein
MFKFFKISKIWKCKNSDIEILEIFKFLKNSDFVKLKIY